MAQSPKTTQGGASLPSKVQLPPTKTVTVSASSLTKEVDESLMPSAGLPQEVAVRPRMPSSSHVQRVCYTEKVEWKAQTGNLSMVDINLRELLWMYCPGVKGNNDRVDRLAGKATITSGFHLGRSEVLRSLRHNLRHKARDITPLIAWGREARKEEAFDDLHRKDETGPSSIRRTLELFHRQRLRDSVSGSHNQGLFRAHIYYLELN